MNNQELLNKAVNDVTKENPGITQNVDDFFYEVSKKFLNSKIDDFPRMCDVARFVNLQHLSELREVGNRGKFDTHFNNETYWSNDGSLMFDYIIPQDLHTFMTVFVYKDFWGESNEKIWRSFMDNICKRRSAMTKYEAENLLIKTKMYYGSNQDLSLTA